MPSRRDSGCKVLLLSLCSGSLTLREFAVVYEPDSLSCTCATAIFVGSPEVNAGANAPMALDTLLGIFSRSRRERHCKTSGVAMRHTVTTCHWCGNVERTCVAVDVKQLAVCLCHHRVSIRRPRQRLSFTHHGARPRHLKCRLSHTVFVRHEPLHVQCTRVMKFTACSTLADTAP